MNTHHTNSAVIYGESHQSRGQMTFTHSYQRKISTDRDFRITSVFALESRLDPVCLPCVCVCVLLSDTELTLRPQHYRIIIQNVNFFGFCHIILPEVVVFSSLHLIELTFCGLPPKKKKKTGPHHTVVPLVLNARVHAVSHMTPDVACRHVCCLTDCGPSHFSERFYQTSLIRIFFFFTIQEV